jgi:hypothetical protein
MNMDATASHSHNTRDTGNRGIHPRKHNTPSAKPTAYTIYRPTNRPLNCGYPVKSTWLKAVQAGNFIRWPLLTVRTIQKYFPETVETPKGHLN